MLYSIMLVSRTEILDHIVWLQPEQYKWTEFLAMKLHSKDSQYSVVQECKKNILVSSTKSAV